MHRHWQAAIDGFHLRLKHVDSADHTLQLLFKAVNTGEYRCSLQLRIQLAYLWLDNFTVSRNINCSEVHFQ
jgi:hypothetical protein